MSRNVLGLAILVAAVMLTGARPQSSPDIEFFEKKIRPVLIESCAGCHGAEKAKGGLRVDSRHALLEGGDSGPSILPGNPEKSILMVAMTGADQDRVMAMPYKKARLDDRILADFQTWIRKGAVWGASPSPPTTSRKVDFSVALEERKKSTPGFHPLRDPAPPSVRTREWPASPIDDFILRNLENAGLAPAPDADKATLLRRLHFDLVGLPPTPEETDAFVRNTAPDAYAKTVDRLLASPHFGEKWARHWLDLVRYGESRGHEFDYVIPNAWHYRDYVIRALNEDLPYPQFLLEHVAGDLLPHPRRNKDEGFNESLLATGWWFLGEWVHSPVDTRADEMDRVGNQIEVFGKTFLGLTIACARCHDHKFDAISQADYYALAGFIKSSDYRQARFESLEHNAGIARELRALERAQAAKVRRQVIDSARPTISRLAATLETPPKPWRDYLTNARKNPEDPFHAFATRRKRPAPAPAGVEVIFDYANDAPILQDGSSFRIVRPGDLRSGTRLDGVFTSHAAATDPAWSGLSLAKGTQKSASRGSWVSSGRRLRTPTFLIQKPNLYYLVRGSGQAFAVVNSHRMINGPLHKRTRVKWKEDTLQWVRQDLHKYVTTNPDRPIYSLHVEFTPTSPNFDVYRIVQGDRPPPLPLDPLAGALPPDAQAIQDLFLKAIEAPTTPLGASALDWIIRNPELSGASTKGADPFLKKRAELVAKLRKQSRTAVAIMDGAGVDEYLLIRGNAHNPGKSVSRRYLEAFGENGDAPLRSRSGRLELAQRMVDPKISPLVPRVRVNRIWHHLFGRGLVASVDDFGKMGQPATHPDLLEFLASRFVEEKGSTKKMIRRIVLSRTYRMSSRAEPAALKKDPANALLHHMPLRRLTAEAIRDSMLAVSGRLNRKVYGPSVPVHLNAFQDGRGKPRNGPLDGDGRRSLYLAVKRNFLSSMMRAFDFPQPFSTMGRRSISNVPTQALFMKNGPFVRQQAGVWAGEVLKRGGSPEERIRRMFRSAFGRDATPEEVRGSRIFLAETATLHRRKPDDREVWQELAHALFQAKEFILLP